MNMSMKLTEVAIKSITTIKFYENYLDKHGRLLWDSYKDPLEKARPVVYRPAGARSVPMPVDHEGSVLIDRTTTTVTRGTGVRRGSGRSQPRVLGAAPRTSILRTLASGRDSATFEDLYKGAGVRQS